MPEAIGPFSVEERMIDGEGQRGGDHATPGDPGINPISRVRGTERPPHDVAQIDVPHQPLVPVLAQAHRERHAVAAPGGQLARFAK